MICMDGHVFGRKKKKAFLQHKYERNINTNRVAPSTHEVWSSSLNIFDMTTKAIQHSTGILRRLKRKAYVMYSLLSIITHHIQKLWLIATRRGGRLLLLVLGKTWRFGSLPPRWGVGCRSHHLSFNRTRLNHTKVHPRTHYA